MLGFKICEIISISYNVYSVGYYCEEVAIRIQLLVVEGARPKRVVSWRVEYAAILIGCKCGIPSEFRCYLRGSRDC